MDKSIGKIGVFGTGIRKVGHRIYLRCSCCNIGGAYSKWYPILGKQTAILDMVFPLPSVFVNGHGSYWVTVAVRGLLTGHPSSRHSALGTAAAVCHL